MLKSTYRSVIPAMLLAAVLGGCDTQEGAGAQGGDEVSSETGAHEFTGFVDRSFAGDDIPAVDLADPDGAMLDLEETGGKPMLLNLWATWCAPCIAEMPLLDDLAGELGDQVRVVTVSEDIDGADAVKAFFAERGFAHLPQWLDPNNDLAFEFGGGSVLPLTVLYNSEGKEVWRVIGAYDWSSEQARALVAEAS